MPFLIRKIPSLEQLGRTAFWTVAVIQIMDGIYWWCGWHLRGLIPLADLLGYPPSLYADLAIGLYVMWYASAMLLAISVFMPRRLNVYGAVLGFVGCGLGIPAVL
jgi:hypothetical protein